MSDFTYTTVGMTGDDGPPPPPGFHSLRSRTLLGHGAEVFRRAERALLTWQMHRAAHLRVGPTVPDAAPGVRVTLRAGPLRIPCEVVWTVHEPNRTGFAYGTLPGHPECGEEAFVVERHADDRVWLTIRAHSRPATWYLRALGPLGRFGQRLAARTYGRALRRLSRGPHPGDRDETTP